MHNEHFDQVAATWDDDPQKIARAAHIADALRKQINLDTNTRVLEYGAGTGLVTQQLQDHVGSVTLADTSEGMRKVMEEKMAAGALKTGEIWSRDISVDEPPVATFDLIVTVLVLHHVEQLERVLASFHKLLSTGGYLAIVDLDAEDGSFHGEGFGGHHGFDRVQLGEQIERAGFTNVTFTDSYALTRPDGEFSTFLVTATRGNSTLP